VSIKELPITPEKVLAAIQEKEEEGKKSKGDNEVKDRDKE
jgi:hypothetical protein